MGLVEEILKNASESGISEALALQMAEFDVRDVVLLFPATRKLRALASGNQVYLCSIVNAKSGRCGEDCRFCAQSSRYKTDVETHELLTPEEIINVAGESKGHRAREFSVVTSGKGIDNSDEVEKIEKAVAGIAAHGLLACVSPGIVDDEVLLRWKDAGLTQYHHNLETAKSFFPQVCTTHEFEEDVEAVRRAKALGLRVCCGGLFGMGESWAQRVELAFTLQGLNVDSVPINFINPIAGTPMAESAPGISPLECLMTIALFRLVLPKARIIICGGREVNLRDLQSFMFDAGASGILIGNYLTTVGRPPEDDLRMIADLGLEPAPP